MNWAKQWLRLNYLEKNIWFWKFIINLNYLFKHLPPTLYPACSTMYGSLENKITYYTEYLLLTIFTKNPWHCSLHNNHDSKKWSCTWIWILFLILLLPCIIFLLTYSVSNNNGWTTVKMKTLHSCWLGKYLLNSVWTDQLVAKASHSLSKIKKTAAFIHVLSMHLYTHVFTCWLWIIEASWLWTTNQIQPTLITRS